MKRPERNRTSKASRNAVHVTVDAKAPESELARQRLIDEATAKKLTRPEVQAAVVIQQLQGDNQEVNALIDELERQVGMVHSGNLERPEAMLFAQAHTLDEVFYTLLRRANANMSAGYGGACETYMRLALKAQAQSRATLQALAEMKNPRPLAFVQQANIANGPQQVNNAVSRADVRDKSNELSKALHELPQNTDPSATAIPEYSTLEAVGEVHRAKDSRGQSQEFSK
jgi:hypothetical protein